ncbi:MAG: hypothetical protein IJW72_04050 [Alphaproteobacteria bacterium]|nr:hypothetical protein [Alphaproteobacteria bacterium]
MKKIGLSIIVLLFYCGCASNQQISGPLPQKKGTYLPDSMVPKPKMDVKLEINPVKEHNFSI